VGSRRNTKKYHHRKTLVTLTLLCIQSSKFTRFVPRSLLAGAMMKVPWAGMLRRRKMASFQER